MIADEWRVVAREPAFRWSWALLVLLVVLCLWNGSRFAADRSAQARAEISRSLEKRVADQRILRQEASGLVPVNPLGPSEPTKAEWNTPRPPGPLAALSFGREDLEPLSATVSLWMVRLDNLFRRYEFGSPVALAEGRFDAGFLVILLLPLIILALSYDLVAIERESGRLRLALVQGEHFGRRLVWRLCCRLTPVVAAVLAIGLVSVALGMPAARLGPWIIGASLYLLFWTGIAAMIATLRWRQEAIGLAAAGIWLFIAVLLPAVTGVLAGFSAPELSPFALITEARQATIVADANAAGNMRRYASDHPEMLTAATATSNFTANNYVSQLSIERRILPIIQAREDRERVRERWASRLSFLSPASAADRLLVDAAGTGRSRQRAYEAQVLAFLERWRTALTPAVFSQRRLNAADLDHLPRFVFREPDMPRGSLWSLPWLALLALASMAFGVRRIDHVGEGEGVGS